MKSTLFTLITLLILFSCKKEDDNNENTENTFTINYSINVSHAEDGTMTLSSINNNGHKVEIVYDDLGDEQELITHSTTVTSNEIIGAKIEMYDETYGIRGDVSIEILNSDGELIDSIEDIYLNTDLPPVYIGLSFIHSLTTGESEMTSDYNEF